MKTILTLLMTLVMLNAFAQKIELSAGVGGGLFFYGGPAAVGHHATTSFGTYSADNLPGKNPGFSKIINFQVNIPNKTFLWGADFQLQFLSSNYTIDTVYNYTQAMSSFKKVNGQSENIETYFSFNPFIGKRFLFKKLSFDITGGLAVAWRLSQTQKAFANSEQDDPLFAYQEPYNNGHLDIRPNINFSLSYKRFCVTTGYYHGINNYYSEYSFAGGEIQNAYSRFVQFELRYFILK